MTTKGQERAYRLVSRALKRGTLKRQPCETCGDPKSEGHHRDYRKPLDVQWLCKRHHFAAHGRTFLERDPADPRPPRAISFQWEKSEAKRLRAEAKAAGVSVSELIRRALRARKLVAA
jgi:hypothetical protein